MKTIFGQDLGTRGGSGAKSSSNVTRLRRGPRRGRAGTSPTKAKWTYPPLGGREHRISMFGEVRPIPGQDRLPQAAASVLEGDAVHKEGRGALNMEFFRTRAEAEENLKLAGSLDAKVIGKLIHMSVKKHVETYNKADIRACTWRLSLVLYVADNLKKIYLAAEKKGSAGAYERFNSAAGAARRAFSDDFFNGTTHLFDAADELVTLFEGIKKEFDECRLALGTPSLGLDRAVKLGEKLLAEIDMGG